MADHAMTPLVSTDWLAQNLGAADLMVFDTTVLIRPGEGGSVEIHTAGEQWAGGHIPGSGRLDLVDELSDPDSPLWFTVPPPEQLAQAFAARGIGEGTAVVLYDSYCNMWATRAWWLLRSIGFDRAAVLDGGLRAWQADGRPLSVDPAPMRAPGRLTASPRPNLFTDSAGVEAAIASGSTCILKSLSAANHSGADAAYGRPGHIPTATNVSAADLVDPATHRYRPLGELRAEFAAAGASDRPVITYCGGGIAATSDAFVLHLLGHDDVAVYDGSLRDWIDRGLPLEV